MPLVLLHGAVTGGLTALGVLAGLAVFVLVIAYVFSALQRDEGAMEDKPSNARRRAQ
jgi:hypothetical protein